MLVIAIFLRLRLEDTYEKAPVKAKAFFLKFVARTEPDFIVLAQGGHPFFWVRRQTPIRVHPEGVTLSCIR